MYLEFCHVDTFNLLQKSSPFTTIIFIRFVVIQLEDTIMHCITDIFTVTYMFCFHHFQGEITTEKADQ